MKKVFVSIVLLLVVLLAGLHLLGSGVLGQDQDAGQPTDSAIPAAVVSARSSDQHDAADDAGVRDPKQILFGDLHVHTTFSTDAFLMSLPISGGEGARPVSDACDYARFCSALDFWSINDHALAITQRRWQETIRGIRECNAVAGSEENPDVSAFLGWEWTQVGSTPETHYGHKNVILRHTDSERIPARPITAGFPRNADTREAPPAIAMGLAVLADPEIGIPLVRYFDEMLSPPVCPTGVAVRDLPPDCTEQAPTPDLLFAKLDDWGHDSIVIPHGTTWGYYTPLGSGWDKQLDPKMHDPARQTLVEIFSGHGNSEEYRDWRSVTRAPDGTLSCPKPSAEYLPSCWQAGEIIRSRCLESGASESDCEERAALTRAAYLARDVAGHHVVPASQIEDWVDSGQCRDCFLPSFNYRPASSVQYMMALGRETESGDPLRFRFGFMASSDNHSARPGTGYKELGRSDTTETRFASFGGSTLGHTDTREPAATPDPGFEIPTTQFFGLLETERQASFFLTGGLIAAHSQGRGRDAIWEAMERKEVYGTSGPRILLWFDLTNPPGTRGDEFPMGSEVAMHDDPIFRVRAVGSLEQKPGCPDHATDALTPDQLQRLCAGECYHPSDDRRLITRIEVVRIRPQARAGEEIGGLIEDPWRVIECDPDPTGCRVSFSDPDFASSRRDAVYYVRAIESPSLAVNAGLIECQGVPLSDDCLGENEERAWSSPIFVDHAAGR